jgi:hypothetical protein
VRPVGFTFHVFEQVEQVGGGKKRGLTSGERGNLLKVLNLLIIFYLLGMVGKGSGCQQKIGKTLRIG